MRYLVLLACFLAACSGTEVKSDIDGDALPCSADDYRCRGSEVQRCEDGSWIFHRDCKADEMACLEGVCVDPGDMPDGDAEPEDGDQAEDDATDGDESEADGPETDETPDGDAMPCPDGCNAELGLFCNEEAGRCEKVECQGCLTDEDCPLTHQCKDDRAAGYKICLQSTMPCLPGYFASSDEYCRPSVACPRLSDIGEPCAWEEKPWLHDCLPGLYCIESLSFNYCSILCETEADCLEIWDDGHCVGASGSDLSICVHRGS